MVTRCHHGQQSGDSVVVDLEALVLEALVMKVTDCQQHLQMVEVFQGSERQLVWVYLDSEG